MAPQVQLPIPEIGAIAATRGMLGAGAALLFADRLQKDQKRKVGWTLFLIGALTTIPLALDVAHKRIPSPKAEDMTAEFHD
jgi:H+/gluconate symporter-like permease